MLQLVTIPRLTVSRGHDFNHPDHSFTTCHTRYQVLDADFSIVMMLKPRPRGHHLSQLAKHTPHSLTTILLPSQPCYLATSSRYLATTYWTSGYSPPQPLSPIPHVIQLTNKAPQVRLSIHCLCPGGTAIAIGLLTNGLWYPLPLDSEALLLSISRQPCCDITKQDILRRTIQSDRCPSLCCHLNMMDINNLCSPPFAGNRVLLTARLKFTIKIQIFDTKSSKCMDISAATTDCQQQAVRQNFS